LHGKKCPRSSVGFCSPCGYSHDGYSQKKIKSLGINVGNYTDRQANIILKNFKNMVLDRQFCSLSNDNKIYFVLTTVGSFFSDTEISFKRKLNILKQVHDLKDKDDIDLCFITEVFAEDIISYERNGKLEMLNDVLTSLDSTIVLGFESANDFVRNNLYLKGLTIEKFENAIEIIKERNIHPAAFAFVGTHTLTQKEIVDDFKNTVKYLYNLSVIPVIMVANLKIGTLDHLLFALSTQKVVEPRTVDTVLNILKDNQKCLAPFPWLIADPVGGPPEPLIHAFNNKKMCTCNDCSYNILAALRYVRKTYDWGKYEMILSPEVRKCTCNAKYEHEIDIEENNVLELEERLKRNISIAEENLNNYFNFLTKYHGGGL